MYFMWLAKRKKLTHLDRGVDYCGWYIVDTRHIITIILSLKNYTFCLYFTPSQVKLSHYHITFHLFYLYTFLKNTLQIKG